MNLFYLSSNDFRRLNSDFSNDGKSDAKTMSQWLHMWHDITGHHVTESSATASLEWTKKVEHRKLKEKQESFGKLKGGKLPTEMWFQDSNEEWDKLSVSWESLDSSLIELR